MILFTTTKFQAQDVDPFCSSAGNDQTIKLILLIINEQNLFQLCKVQNRALFWDKVRFGLDNLQKQKYWFNLDYRTVWFWCFRVRIWAGPFCTSCWTGPVTCDWIGPGSGRTLLVWTLAAETRTCWTCSGSQSSEAQVLDLQVLVHAAPGPLSAQTGLLDPPEGGLGGRQDALVDPDHAHLQGLGHTPDLSDVLRVEVTCGTNGSVQNSVGPGGLWAGEQHVTEQNRPTDGTGSRFWPSVKAQNLEEVLLCVRTFEQRGTSTIKKWLFVWNCSIKFI